MLGKIIRLECMSGKAKATGNPYTMCTGVFAFELDVKDQSVTMPTYTRTKLGSDIGKYDIDESAYPHFEKQYLKNPDALIEIELGRKFDEAGKEQTRVIGFKEAGKLSAAS